MIIQPKVRGFICTTTHPLGCEANVKNQIAYAESRKIQNGPKHVLVIGASTGYGLASRINAAFGAGAATIGVFFEKPGTEKKPGTAGWYNSAYFDKAAKAAGLYSKSINGDAFSDECRQKVIDIIKKDLGTIDLVVYSLAAPVRKMPETGEVVRSSLKPVGKTYTTTAVDTNKDEIITSSIEPATEQEIENTVKVMGGQDWELWIRQLDSAGVLARGCRTVAYSYIGTSLTWPIYWEGTLGYAKEGSRQGNKGQHRGSQEYRRIRQCRSAEVRGNPGFLRDPGNAALHFPCVQEDAREGRSRDPDHAHQPPVPRVPLFRKAG